MCVYCDIRRGVEARTNISRCVAIVERRVRGRDRRVCDGAGERMR